MTPLMTLGCAVCGAGDDPAKTSYVLMTLLISFLPLAMLGGLALYFYRRASRAEQTKPESRLDG